MGMTDLRVETLPHRGRVAFARPLADLRTDYFSEYPYLQTPDHKTALQEMRSLCMDPEVLIVAAFEADTLVGCIIIGPFTDADMTRQGGWFERNGLDRSKWVRALYTLTKPHCRQRGVNAAMGDLVNTELARRGVEGRIAMVIRRRPDDPKAPQDYHDPVGFFLKRGYEHTDITPLSVAWRGIGDEHPTPKQYIFMARRTQIDA